jgi:hypothetical protein
MTCGISYGGLTLATGSALTFSVTGSVNNVPSPPTLPPDGDGIVSTSANNGIAAVSAPLNSLLGVFLGPSQPDGSPAPSSLDFSGSGLGTVFTTLSPGLKQVFFIGDGLTGNGTGATQRFTVPAGATRLFLGTDNGVGWFNNSGSFSVTVTEIPVVSVTVPTLGSRAILGLALVLAALGVWVMLRR